MTYEVKIHDVTLRDGEQTQGVVPTVDSKLKVTKLLDDYGVQVIEGGGFPKANDQNRGYFETVGGLNTNAKIAIFLRTSLSDVREAAEALSTIDRNKRVFTIVGKSSKEQILDKVDGLGKDPDRYLQEIKDCIYESSKQGEVVYDAEFGFEALAPWLMGNNSTHAKEEYEYALKTIYSSLDGGAKLIYLCGTTGAQGPVQTTKVINDIAETVGIDKIGIHPHDDRALALAIALAAASEGVEWFQTTVNGIGERSGNLDLTDLLCNLYDEGIVKWPYLDQSTDVSRNGAKIIGVRLSRGHRYTSEEAFAHAGGMHSRSPKYYLRVNPEIFGNRENFPYTRQAGRGLILRKAEEWGVNLDGKEDEVTKNLLRAVHKIGIGGDAQFVKLLWNEIGGEEPFTSDIVVPNQILRLKDDSAITNVYAALLVDGARMEATTSSDEGSMKAMDLAYNQILSGKFPGLKNFGLEDYYVDKFGNGGTASKVIVVAEYRMNSKKYPVKSITIHSDEVMANLRNLSDAYLCAIVGGKLPMQYDKYLSKSMRSP